MLLANMAKSESIALRCAVVLDLTSSDIAVDQLIELFNKGANGGYNAAANYDYLGYVFADMVMVRYTAKPSFTNLLRRFLTTQVSSQPSSAISPQPPVFRPCHHCVLWRRSQHIHPHPAALPPLSSCAISLIPTDSPSFSFATRSRCYRISFSLFWGQTHPLPMMSKISCSLSCNTLARTKFGRRMLKL